MIEWCNPTSTAQGTGDKAKTDPPRFASPINTRLVTSGVKPRTPLFFQASTLARPKASVTSTSNIHIAVRRHHPASRQRRPRHLTRGHNQKPEDLNEAAQPADMERTPLPSDHGGKVLHQSTKLALRAIEEQGDELRPDKYSERRCLPHLRG
jgi:hypothetical protein